MMFNVQYNVKNGSEFKATLKKKFAAVNVFQKKAN